MKAIISALGVATLVLATGLLSGCTEPGPSFADRCVSYGYQPGTQLFLNCIGQQQGAAIQAYGIYQGGLSAMRPQTIYVTPCTIYGRIANEC
jgi:hypothetical protein